MFYIIKSLASLPGVSRLTRTTDCWERAYPRSVLQTARPIRSILATCPLHRTPPGTARKNNPLLPSRFYSTSLQAGGAASKASPPHASYAIIAVFGIWCWTLILPDASCEEQGFLCRPFMSALWSALPGSAAASPLSSQPHNCP